MSEEHHRYELVSVEGDTTHLRCPTCGKEISVTRGTHYGYRVLRNEAGELLQGDFAARHTWGNAPDIEVTS